MKQERRAIRAGVALILLAAVWRLGAGGAWVPVADFFQKPEVAAFLVYLGTGRVVHPEAQAQTEPTEPLSVTLPTGTEPTEPERNAVNFSAEDSALFSVYDLCGYSVDGAALLQQPLDWELAGSEPTVLIFHTHATESYTKAGQTYEETGYYRTRDTEYNMVKVGAQLAQQLESAGISVIHDTTLHDYPSYTGSYNHARKAVQSYLEQYPSIKLVLDLHRDAALNPNGTQMATEATVDGRDSAQLMIVAGSDASGLTHPNWRENMALAAKLHVVLEKNWAGVTRPVCFRAERFNQDLMPGMLLVEVGTAGNTLPEALIATDCLAQAIIQLTHGANVE